MSISIKSRKSKSRRLQQYVRDAILEKFPELESDDVKSATMGESGEDIKLSPAARRLLGISVECKAQEKVNVWSSWEQCPTNTPDGANSVLVIKRNNSPTLVMVDLKFLLQLLRDANG